MSGRAKIILPIAVFLVLCLAGGCLALLVFTGVIVPNSSAASEYEILGVDISSYQGSVDFVKLSGQGVSFAYIKATEGSSMVDRMFAENFEKAEQTDVRVGAYHFFSFDSAGSTQAENFISTVEAADGMLPPAVDVELYGDYLSHPPEDTEKVKGELRVLLDALEEKYGMKPVIYATSKSYKLFIKGDFDRYDLWIRDVLHHPSVDGWVFWQYSNRGRLDGYDGKEKYIDLNVFYADAEKFENYGK